MQSECSNLFTSHVNSNGLVIKALSAATTSSDQKQEWLRGKKISEDSLSWLVYSSVIVLLSRMSEFTLSPQMMYCTYDALCVSVYIYIYKSEHLVPFLFVFCQKYMFAYFIGTIVVVVGGVAGGWTQAVSSFISVCPLHHTCVCSKLGQDWSRWTTRELSKTY